MVAPLLIATSPDGMRDIRSDFEDKETLAEWVASRAHELIPSRNTMTPRNVRTMLAGGYFSKLSMIIFVTVYLPSLPLIQTAVHKSGFCVHPLGSPSVYSFLRGRLRQQYRHTEGIEPETSGAYGAFGYASFHFS